MFEHRVLEITEDIMLKWRLLVEEGRKACVPNMSHSFDRHRSRNSLNSLHYADRR
jgi:hypothetical protein